ncbi:hypothetical protein BIY24_03675 [Halobacteriovorax marinus]|uniref:hypothetical protein n=1 Tax=Halobacteriovorax marinus TaxID=97084 RepID=UPI000BC33D37|nr:hypothetical protein [Halobacteriovorax marinus]ATH07066.1 hypothetical protein BIY24_03675 [Halobacteriovorax marinus]
MQNFKRLPSFILLLAMSLAPLSTLSAEIDSYRNARFSGEGSSYIDSVINERMKSAVLELNDLEVACPVNAREGDDVYDVMKSHISSPFIGHAIAVEFDETLPEGRIVRTNFDYSVYSTINWLEGVSLNLKGLLGVTKIGGRRVGVDKLGHFFVEGFGFFRRAYVKKEGSVANAIRWGKFTENSYFGLTTTGVYSNADLVANFNGMRFWNMLFLFEKDAAFNSKNRYSETPFLSCDNAKWKLNKKFSIRYFVDDAWDESLNCNYYDSEKIQDAVVNAQAIQMGYSELSKNDGMVCPRVKRDCSYEKYKYGKFARDLLHESCFDEKKAYRVNPELYNYANFPSFYDGGAVYEWSEWSTTSENIFN